MFLTLSSLTDIGNQRPNNEDNLVAYDLDQQILLPAHFNHHPISELGVLLLISDGMGGCNAGEIASQMAVDNIPRHLLSSIGQKPLAGVDVIDALKSALILTHLDISKHSQANPDTRNMGATATLIWISPQQQWVGHIGDSRLYRLRNKQLEQLTQDHSPVGRLLREGSITEKLAQQHPQRHLLEQALGAGIPQIQPDAFSIQVKEGDSYLLCTDGLNDSLSKEAMQHTLNQIAKPLSLRAQELIEDAKAVAGMDNISLQLASISHRDS